MAVVAVGLLAQGCARPSGGGGGGGGGGGNANGNDNGSVGGIVTGGFDDAGLAQPSALPVDVENLPPSGDLIFPPEGITLGVGDTALVWEAADQNGTNVDSTVYVSDQPEVFDNPLVTTGLRTSPEDEEHRLSVQFGEAGTFYWGVQITDGVNTIQRPTSGVGVQFAVSETGGGRTGLEDAILLCPRGTQPAREMTTFQWSLGQVVPVRTEVFVSRAGQDDPFETPLSVFEVEPPTAESRPLSEDEALPLGQELSWGLRIETADEVLFTFEGQLGELFVVEENVPPTGQLLAPANETVMPDGDLLELVWADTAGNCEDELILTIALELLGDAAEPAGLFDSEIQLTAQADRAEADLFPQLMDLELEGGRWAWGILADDGTDQTMLPDADNPERTFRTFIRDTSPRLVDAPAVATRLCDQAAFAGNALVFSFEDDNGAETVTARLTFAATAGGVFDSPASSMDVSSGSAGDTMAEIVVFLEGQGTADCPAFANGTGFYGVELDDGVNPPVQAMVEFTGATPTGACCTADGSCSEVAADDCVGGSYQGDGTTCASVDCQAAQGACCLPDGGCTEGPASECADGDYQGDGTTCQTVSCPQAQAEGACCLADGSCMDGPADQCLLGVYQGNGTTCQTLICVFGQPEGACCFSDGSCSDGPENQCSSGTYQGDGTTCAAADCTPAQVADCNTNGVPDDQDIALGTSRDCNTNGQPDECEGVVFVVGAGTLADGTIDLQDLYDSAADNNDLQGWVCPVTGTPSVRWLWESGPLGAEVSITNASSLSTPFTVSPAIPGTYVFRLTWVDQDISATVTLTLQGP